MISVKSFVPPIALSGLRRLRKAVRPAPAPSSISAPLFDGDCAMFKRASKTCTVYGEYGVGASTNWIYTNTQVPIIANDLSPHWAAKTMAGKDPERVELQYVDVGDIGAWGRPVDYRKRDNFLHYCTSIWNGQRKPDLVLIDGRFRVGCFLTSILEGPPGLRIIVDDYRDRPHYHLVEELLPVIERCGRQAMFEVAGDIDLALVARLRDQFVYVMD